jgi:hypothetical protein
MLRVMLWVWQLPQNLLGLLLIRILKARRVIQGQASFNKDVRRAFGFKRVGLGKILSGVSLGSYIIVSEGASPRVMSHEYGHCMQSKLFGPLCLLLVGVPSCLFNNVWDRLMHKSWPDERRIEWYYSRYPEKWADKLGGVSR